MQTIGQPTRLERLQYNARVANRIFAVINDIYNAPGYRRVRGSDARKTRKSSLIFAVMREFRYPRSKQQRGEIRNMVFNLVSRYG